MKIYKGNTYYCPTYEENVTTRKPGSKRKKRKKAKNK